jgi:hypothetical protein
MAIAELRNDNGHDDLFLQQQRIRSSLRPTHSRRIHIVIPKFNGGSDRK